MHRCLQKDHSRGRSTALLHALLVMLVTAVPWSLQGPPAALVADPAAHLVALAGAAHFEKSEMLKFKLLRSALNRLECLPDSFETLRPSWAEKRGGKQTTFQ